MTGRGSGLPETCMTCPYFESFDRRCRHRARQVILDVLADDNRCPYYEEIRRQAMQELEHEICEEGVERFRSDPREDDADGSEGT